MLSVMFDPESPFKNDMTEDGVVKLDQDPEAFSWILGWLRRGSLSGAPSSHTRRLICEAADYFGLDGLVEQLRNLPDDKVELKVWALRPANWGGYQNGNWDAAQKKMDEVNQLLKDGWHFHELKRARDIASFFGLPSAVSSPAGGDTLKYRLLERQSTA